MIPEKGKVLVDFWAQWCGPCKMMLPKVDQFSEEQKEIEVVKINVDEHSDIAAQYGIRSIPTFIYLEDGEVIDKQTGAMTLEQLKEFTKA